MDCDWKEFAFDSAVFELTNGGGFGGQNNGGSSDFVPKSTAETSKDSRDSKIVSSSSTSGSLKRSRIQNGSQNMTCSVDGCDSDLSNCRDYHRRHRVCEKHSKTPIVLVGGKQQRFCQQCSRFHSLGEFDEVKRSCRKRLDGHNRRRRKPQPPSLFMAAEKFLSNYKGPRILQFGNPQAYANPIMRNFWPLTSKTEAQTLSFDHHRPLHSVGQQSQLNSFANVQHWPDKHLPLWQANSTKAGYGSEELPGISTSQPIFGSISPPASGNGSQKLSSDGKTGSINSGCALYLLSTLQTQSSQLSLVQSSINCPTQSSSGDAHSDAADKCYCSEIAKDNPAAPVLVLDANSTNLHCNGTQHMGPDGLLDNGDLLTLPFFWE